ncbi:alpha/beta fold hydrolase [Streptomyces sp. CA-249302]|uniref:alpha/beta fold hydrolase n=1 Tax=Streptomyces sp. CA-249302 TaxID=3240058 RepID=UPI003D92FDE4
MIQYLISVNGVTTRVLEARPENVAPGRPSLVLVHGLGARADRWRENIDALAAEGCHVLAFDLPGHGLAQKGELPYSVPFYADYLKGVIDALALDKVVLVGTSLGGHVCAYAVTRHPRIAVGLVLVGAVGLLPAGEQARELIGASVLNTTRDGIEGKLRFVFRDPSLVTEDLVHEEYRVNNSPGAHEAAALLSEYFRTRLDDDVVGPQLAERVDTLPLLLVWGADDIVVPVAVAEAAQRLLGPVPLLLVREAGHAPYLEKSGEFNDIVLRFLSKPNGAHP